MPAGASGRYGSPPPHAIFIIDEKCTPEFARLTIESFGATQRKIRWRIVSSRHASAMAPIPRDAGAVTIA